MTNHGYLLRTVAHFLSYPDQEWYDTLQSSVDTVRQEADALPQELEVLQEFVDYIKEQGLDGYEADYVKAFDFSQNTNLYLTMHNRTDFGKQSEDLQMYKRLFLDNGLDIEHELPDYLPALLELASHVDEKNALDILNVMQSSLEVMRERFIEGKLIHAFLLELIFTEKNRLEGVIT